MQAAVGDLERRGAQQLVLDLSDNRGGLVSEAIEIARLFLPGGSTVVSTRSVSSTNVTRVEKSTPVTVRPCSPGLSDVAGCCLVEHRGESAQRCPTTGAVVSD